jgi:hypothetical protein
MFSLPYFPQSEFLDGKIADSIKKIPLKKMRRPQALFCFIVCCLVTLSLNLNWVNLLITRDEGKNIRIVRVLF